MRKNLVSRARSVAATTAGISLALLASAAIAGGVAAADATQTQAGQLREHFLLEHAAEATS
jgi:hypothetical protein